MKMKSSLPFKYITTVKDGKHYVVFDYKDNEGKRKRKWIGTDLPEKCAKKALNLKVEEIITAFLRDWLETIKPTIAETTYESYSQKLNSVVSYFDTVFPDITLAEVTAVELQKFYNDKFAEEITANMIKHYHANIHKALKYAVKIGLISCNESEKTDRPKLDKYEATFYNSKKLERLFSVFREYRMEVVMLFAAYYGLRRSEIIGLRWDAIDFDNNTITIHAKAYNVYEDGKPVMKFDNKLKTKASHRTLPLIPSIADVLRAKKEQDEYLSTVLKSGYDHEYEDYICTDKFGRLITPNYATDHFANVIKKYKLKKIRFHDLRYSCASLLLANGVPMKAIQEWFGHSTFHVTISVPNSNTKPHAVHTDKNNHYNNE